MGSAANNTAVGHRIARATVSFTWALYFTGITGGRHHILRSHSTVFQYSQDFSGVRAKLIIHFIGFAAHGPKMTAHITGVQPASSAAPRVIGEFEYDAKQQEVAP